MPGKRAFFLEKILPSCRGKKSEKEGEWAAKTVRLGTVWYFSRCRQEEELIWPPSFARVKKVYPAMLFHFRVRLSGYGVPALKLGRLRPPRCFFLGRSYHRGLCPLCGPYSGWRLYTPCPDSFLIACWSKTEKLLSLYRHLLGQAWFFLTADIFKWVDFAPRVFSAVGPAIFFS